MGCPPGGGVEFGSDKARTYYHGKVAATLPVSYRASEESVTVTTVGADGIAQDYVYQRTGPNSMIIVGIPPNMPRSLLGAAHRRCGEAPSSEAVPQATIAAPVAVYPNSAPALTNAIPQAPAADTNYAETPQASPTPPVPAPAAPSATTGALPAPQPAVSSAATPAAPATSPASTPAVPAAPTEASVAGREDNPAPAAAPGEIATPSPEAATTPGDQAATPPPPPAAPTLPKTTAASSTKKAKEAQVASNTTSKKQDAKKTKAKPEPATAPAPETPQTMPATTTVASNESNSASASPTPAAEQQAAAAAAAAPAPTPPAASNQEQAGWDALNGGDAAKAVSIWEPLAKGGNTGLAVNVADMYEYGEKLPQDYGKAARWYEMAANQGDGYAQYQIGRAYTRGMGVPIDRVQAYKWLSLAMQSQSNKTGGKTGKASKMEIETALNDIVGAMSQQETTKAAQLVKQYDNEHMIQP
jgi:hypothetical protein